MAARLIDRGLSKLDRQLTNLLKATGFQDSVAFAVGNTRVTFLRLLPAIGGQAVRFDAPLTIGSRNNIHSIARHA